VWSPGAAIVAKIARRVLRSLAVACAALGASGAALAQDSEALAARYAAWQKTVEQDSTGPRLAIASETTGNRMRGDIDGVVPAPFATLAARLASPGDWCEIALLHLNVKTCTHERGSRGPIVTFYSGSKRFQAPEQAYALQYRFRIEKTAPEYIAIALTATTGPLETRDYSIVVEAMPVGSHSFIHLSYAYRPSAASKLATGTYLATVGASKKGFSIIGRERDGSPSYVSGLRGVVERNAVRNFLAIQAFLEGCDLPLPSRVTRALERWFDLTERYPLQLRELERAEYLAVKEREYRQQVERQQAIDTAAQSTPTATAIRCTADTAPC
jgi:hypothetical protein